MLLGRHLIGPATNSCVVGKSKLDNDCEATFQDDRIVS